jgi:hypothetical protein
MSRTYRIWTSAGLGAVAVAGLTWWRSLDVEPKDRIVEVNAVEETSANRSANSQRMQGLFWPNQTRMVYEASINLRLQMRDQPAFELEVGGEMHFIPALASAFPDTQPGDETVLFAELRDVTVSTREAPLSPDEEQAYVAAFAQPLAAVLDGEGFVRRFRVQSSSMPAATQALKDLLMGLGLHESTHGNATWEVPEIDATGRYFAAYRREKAGEITRVKGPYNEFLRAVPPNFRYEKAASFARFNLGARRELIGFEWDETRKAAGHGPLAAAESSMKVALKSKGQSSAHGLLAELAARFASYEPADIHESASKHTREAQRDLAWLKGMSAAQIMEGLETIDGSKSESERQRLGEMYLAAVSLVRLDEHSREEFLRRAQSKNPKAGIYIDALGDSGDLEAIKGLLRFKDDASLSLATKQHAVRVMGSRAIPDAQVVSEMLALAGDPQLGQTASLSLGALLGNAREEGAAIHDEGGKQLVSAFKNAASPAEQINWLGALANAGYRGAWEEIKPLFASESASNRRMAVAGASKIAGDDVTRELIKLVRYDTDSYVRDDALRVLGTREFGMEIQKCVVDALLHDRSRIVRGSAAGIMVRWPKERGDAEVLAALAYAREHEVDAEVRGILAG